jgi:CDP-diacylglycerol--glycerol-3-phosphate 3-phosphatidyltransferase
MLNIFARASVSRVTDPIGALLHRTGLTPNAMTIFGTACTVVGALWLFPTGHLLAGTFVAWGFAMFDLLDGAMARARGYGTKFGAVLDAACDRIVDGAVMGSVAWWCFVVANDKLAAAACLVSLVLGQVTSYIKARAEASGLEADGGLIERAERLIITLVSTGLEGLGVPHAVVVGLCLLTVLSVVTVMQRFMAVARSSATQAKESG